MKKVIAWNTLEIRTLTQDQAKNRRSKNRATQDQAKDRKRRKRGAQSKKL